MIPAQLSRKHSPAWWEPYASNVYSQHGEDGVIEQALRIIGDNDKWCVEFGAWDGEHLSNTCNLIRTGNYDAVLIEGDRERYSELAKKFKMNPHVTTLNAFVGFSEDDGLDSLLASTGVPANFDLLSIDIDGNDYHVWEAMRSYRPKIVVVEYNATVPNEVDFVQARDMKVSQGNGALSLQRLGKDKGYELIAVTASNLIFVDERYYDQFAIGDNSLDALRTDHSALTYLFQGYDGTVFVRGNTQLIWHGVPFSEAKMQQLPRILRGRPPGFGPLRMALLSAYRILRVQSGLLRARLGMLRKSGSLRLDRRPN